MNALTLMAKRVSGQPHDRHGVSERRWTRDGGRSDLGKTFKVLEAGVGMVKFAPLILHDLEQQGITNPLLQTLESVQTTPF